ncbi:hypothetical protein HMPREF3216_01126 [Gardnerella vaginalis]|uniref:Uncharacterized protein n=1 Tax=Gardnerella vaginalis TaxID=2702 RepID=A0A133NML3_GARVA|nr:hypothetical protein HMPREF3216_01126 [Gardnerella vaginalis]
MLFPRQSNLSSLQKHLDMRKLRKNTNANSQNPNYKHNTKSDLSYTSYYHI